MTRITLLAAALAATLPLDNAFAVDPAVLEAQQRRVEVVEKVAPAVVAIFGASGGGGGSGVLISPDGFALTNFHVTNGAGDFMKCGLSDGKLYDAVVVGIDPTGDVALVKLLGRDDFPTAPLGDSDKVQIGDWAYAMGNPFLLATDFRPTVTYGIVSGVHRYQEPAGNNFLEYTDCIQVDSSINPGNSGGPLFNDQGEVIGINGRGSFEKRGRVNSGAGYAISINQIKHFLEYLKSGRIVDHATLGATVTSRSDGAIMVSDILEESEAYRRGLRSGDELISFAGRSIRSVNQFKNILGIYPKGWKLPLVFRRDGQRHTIYPRLRALHRASDFDMDKQQPMPVPGDPREPKDPDDPKNPKDPKDPKKPPQPRIVRPGQPKPPEKYKHMLVKKDGFANYYFNELEQKRLAAELAKLGDFKEVGAWTLGGQTAAGKPFTLSVSFTEARLELGGETATQPVTVEGGIITDAQFADKPAGTGGLLPALYNFRLLLTAPQRFSDRYYLGAEPLDGNGPQVDVLITKLISAETRWYFDQNDGRLVGFDTYLNEDVDPCEVRITEYAEFDGRTLPKTFTVTTGVTEFATFNVTSAEFQPATDTDAETEE